jgi:MFS family permease
MTPRRLHPAWIVLFAVTFCMLAATGVRNVFSVYIKPMEAEFGWSRGALSGAAALSLLLLGAVGPWAGRLADRWGTRRLILGSITLLGAGTIAFGFAHQLWHVYLAAGVLMAVGAGGLGMATGSVVATRWFDSKRGLAIGLVAGGMSAGQLLIIPLATMLTVTLSWRVSTTSLGIGLLLVVLPIAFFLVRDDPAEAGLRPYGATGIAPTAAQKASAQRAGRVSVVEAARAPQFWLLLATFFVCGYTTGGIVLTHFMPHALEHNFTSFEASTALGIMGAMNVVGTIASGWLCDRLGRRGPLATYYFVRGLSLILLIYVWNVPSLHIWAALFGLNFISTVPPTTTLTANIFGRYSVGELSGWIFFSHQVGAALAAALAGWIYEWYGNYYPAFLSGAILAFIAAALTLAIREKSVVRPVLAAREPAIA